MYTATVSSKAQITLPAALRARINIRPGDVLKLSVRNKSIVLEPDNYEEKMLVFREKIRSHIQKHGLSSMTVEESRQIADKEKAKLYSK